MKLQQISETVQSRCVHHSVSVGGEEGAWEKRGLGEGGRKRERNSEGEGERNGNGGRREGSPAPRGPHCQPQKTTCVRWDKCVCHQETHINIFTQRHATFERFFEGVRRRWRGRDDMSYIMGRTGRGSQTRTMKTKNKQKKCINRILKITHDVGG